MTNHSVTPVPFWLRSWAWLTVALCLPLATLGAEVTTKNVGMVDPQGLRSPLYLFQPEVNVPGQPMRLTHLLQTQNYGLLIEHAHRVAGWMLGLACIVLCVGLLAQVRDWRLWLGVLALVAVSVQGLLGIFRVSQISTELAALHACSAQLVFSLLVAVAIMLSNAWTLPGSRGALHWYALGLFALIFVQIVCGALMRHLLDPLAQRLHILLAFVVVVGILWLVAKVFEYDRSATARTVACLLLGFILLQPVLGVEAWVRRFGSMELPDAIRSTFWGDFFRSGHHVLGTMILATTAGLTALLFRPREKMVPVDALHARALEGVV